ncbi:MFS general substrate transporter [Mollisia scopiformis]|uniref:MFS general substrate transporter n=1 Tax=Mollisia scopiformis TaxID=149040 RepID=A0A194XNG3_MOLSC|nr:MFS general substrate transporter [Mollisia scopiformis]KUJ21691.1 MFS general substrate transporter [Mollisia scopiformis]
MEDKANNNAEPHGLATEVDVEKANAPPLSRVQTEDEYPSGIKVFIIMMAAFLSMFLVALDRTILGTAIPKITDQFHSIDDVGWYASAYLLTSCAFQLIYGRIYTFYSPKWVLLCAIGLFELGSTVCGAAPTSKAFIVGRAIAGLGSAGILSGVINIMVITIPLHKRPMYQAVFGAVFGLASVAGPLLGGVFTTKVSWRWCFYINLPIGGVVVAVIVLMLKDKPSTNTDTLKQQLWKLDPFGSLVFLPGIICLLLALQWGGTTYPWSNARVIVLFIISGILLSLFVFIQFRMGDNATVPIHIIKQRSVASGAYFSVMSPGSMMVMIYYLPLWFQAIKNVTAVHSGIDTLPLVMSLVVASMSAGAITAKTGYYVGQLIASSIIMSVGAGLLTTLQVDTGHAKWIAYQFLYGFGLGLGMQQAGMAAQTCLNKKDVMTGVSLMFFMQGLGGSVFISISQTIFTHGLIKYLGDSTGISPNIIVNTGATDLRNLVPAADLGTVLVAYNKALSDTFKVGLACACVTIVAGFTMEWKSVKGLKHGGQQSPPADNNIPLEDQKAPAPNTDEGHVTDTETAVGKETPPTTLNDTPPTTAVEPVRE